MRRFAPALLAALAMAGPSAAHADVLVVGDSLGVGTDGALRAALPDQAIDSDNRVGRPSGEGVSVLGELIGPQYDVVVFDLGTNDGNASIGATAASLAAAREIAGDRCLVVATLNRPPLAGIPIDGQNAMIRRFVDQTPNAVLVAWNDAAQSTTGALREDGVHATPGGYSLRGVLFAEAITSCLAGDRSFSPSDGSGPAASATSRPADRAPAPAGPPLEARLASAVATRIAEGPAAELARSAAATVAIAAETLRDVLTPRGPEPVLGVAP